jgi:hypothetical protein
MRWFWAALLLLALYAADRSYMNSYYTRLIMSSVRSVGMETVNLPRSVGQALSASWQMVPTPRPSRQH